MSNAEFQIPGPLKFDIRHSKFDIPAVAVLGTASHVGKSVIAAGLCRILRRRGLRVAPFKAQNMSNNSFVTPLGGEIGRAQALQAEACGIPPTADMNPVLLKPESDGRSQVVVQGKVWRTEDARAYFSHGPELFERVRESYGRLAAEHDVIVIEGAGSCAEVNLRDRDFVNWRTAELADARVLLVADVDRGGVFAQVLGTLDLLAPEERRRVAGIVINRFRGDRTLFDDGVLILEERSGLPVLGVVPFLRDLALEEEDAVGVDGPSRVPFRADAVNVAVVLLSRMSNFTDVRAPAAEPDVALRWAATPADLAGADVVILPGSKATIADLADLRRRGFAEALAAHAARGGELAGLCGGYQMLGRSIADPGGVEGGGSAGGLGLLDVSTELLTNKFLTQVEAVADGRLTSDGSICNIVGYEIHLGVTQRAGGRAAFRIIRREGGTSDAHGPVELLRNFEISKFRNNSATPGSSGEPIEDGCISDNGRIWGTYLHGVFDAPGFRRAWLNRARARKGLPPLPASVSEETTARLNGALDRWADHLVQHLDLSTILEMPDPDGHANSK